MLPGIIICCLYKLQPPPPHTHTQSKDVAGGDGGMEAGEERERLLALVRIQVREIEAIREEIQVLQLKGGRIAPPPQPPPQTV